ncbi:MAG: nitrogenase iron-molybdenum cofactor biosynthesis protein NifE [Magnetococcales bacterium]|nr:nitrogenase iron-molybdenum cofactor biosynthesis protein NifE [Magnetococcales bacterium]
MKTAEIAALLDEPACAHNRGPKSGCARLKPGATAGGCSFDGAQIVLFPIADAAHIVHGPIACAGSSWNGRGALSSGPDFHRLGMTTDLTEQDIIMGRGEKRLLFGIKQAVERYRPAAVFVYQTCVPAATGDDLATVCRTAAEAWGTPVIPVDAAGFYGTKNLGNRIAGETLVRHVVGTREPASVPPGLFPPEVRVHDVALIGEFNIAGEFWHVQPLLEELGLRILCTLSGDARFAQVQTLHRSRATMLVCSKALINVTRLLQERYGTPWFEGSFYGIRDTSAALREFARLLDDFDLAARTEALIAREEAAIRQTLAPLAARLAGKRVLLYTGGVKSWSVVSALQDLGMEVVATGTRKSTEGDKARIRELMGRDAIMIDEGNPKVLAGLAEAQRADLIMAGGRNMFTALKSRLPFLDINQEREAAYAGYRGMEVLARQLLATLESPVWAAVRQPAPWETGPNEG